MILNRCDCCCGKKTVVGLGNIKKTCTKCVGVGYVKIDTKVADDVKAKRKKGEWDGNGRIFSMSLELTLGQFIAKRREHFGKGAN